MTDLPKIKAELTRQSLLCMRSSTFYRSPVKVFSSCTRQIASYDQKLEETRMTKRVKSGLTRGGLETGLRRS